MVGPPLLPLPNGGLPVVIAATMPVPYAAPLPPTFPPSVAPPPPKGPPPTPAKSQQNMQTGSLKLVDSRGCDATVVTTTNAPPAVAMNIANAAHNPAPAMMVNDPAPVAQTVPVDDPWHVVQPDDHPRTLNYFAPVAITNAFAAGNGTGDVVDIDWGPNFPSGGDDESDPWSHLDN